MAFKSLKRIYKPTTQKGKIFSSLTNLILYGILAVVGIMVLTVVFFVTQMPSPQELSSRNVAKATKIFDRNGELLYDIFSDENRSPIKLEEVPLSMRQATIAIEDKDFYKHQGFDLVGIGRSFFMLAKNRQIEGGGSTLTQQLVKNALLTSDQSFIRKIKELILSVEVERTYTKDQILEMYLNEIPYGGTAYGVEAASNLYFGKHAKELNLAESSLLAGLPQRPSVYSPYGTNPELARERQAQVLKRMVDDKYITQAQADEAKNTPLTYRTSQLEIGFKAPHFVLFVKNKLIEQFGDKLVEQGGLRVTTTLDYKLQETAQQIVKDEVDKLTKAKVGNGAAVVLDPRNGEVLAMVGSKDYFGESTPAGCDPGVNCMFDSNVNIAVRSRQPGSATKPITYAKALQKNYTASTVLIDTKTDFAGGIGQPTYSPANYDGKYRGPTQIRYALGNSLNVPAVKMLALVGIRDVMDLAYRMGLSNWEPSEENIANVGLSLTLGGRETSLLDLTSAFGVFGNRGYRQEPVTVLKVTDSNDKVLFEYKPTDGQKVLEEDTSFIISDILSDNGARTAVFGSNSLLNIPNYQVAVKTGTTDEKRDNWAIGYTPYLAVGTWVGNNNRAPMDPSIASGVTGATPIWKKVMMAALLGKQNQNFSRPDNVIQVDVDGLMGGLPKDGSPTRKEYFIRGTEPLAQSPAYQNRKVCRVNVHRLAKDNEDGDGRDVVVLEETDPTGANKWQEAIDKWVLTAADARLVGATVGCDGIPGFTTGGGNISITNIANGANVPRVFDVVASVNSSNGVKKVTWIVDGGVAKSGSSEPYALHVEFPKDDRGSHTITVTLEDNSGATFSASVGVTINL